MATIIDDYVMAEPPGAETLTFDVTIDSRVGF
jgi:hypothetical protein